MRPPEGEGASGRRGVGTPGCQWTRRGRWDAAARFTLGLVRCDRRLRGRPGPTGLSARRTMTGRRWARRRPDGAERDGPDGRRMARVARARARPIADRHKLPLSSRCQHVHVAVNTDAEIAGFDPAQTLILLTAEPASHARSLNRAWARALDEALRVHFELPISINSPTSFLSSTAAATKCDPALADIWRRDRRCMRYLAP